MDYGDLEKLQALVEDPIACGYLRAFSQSEYNAENIDFWIEVDRFKDNFSDPAVWPTTRTFRARDNRPKGPADGRGAPLFLGARRNTAAQGGGGGWAAAGQPGAGEGAPPLLLGGGPGLPLRLSQPAFYRNQLQQQRGGGARAGPPLLGPAGGGGAAAAAAAAGALPGSASASGSGASGGGGAFGRAWSREESQEWRKREMSTSKGVGGPWETARWRRPPSASNRFSTRPVGSGRSKSGRLGLGGAGAGGGAGSAGTLTPGGARLLSTLSPTTGGGGGGPTTPSPGPMGLLSRGNASQSRRWERPSQLSDCCEDRPLPDGGAYAPPAAAGGGGELLLLPSPDDDDAAFLRQDPDAAAKGPAAGKGAGGARTAAGPPVSDGEDKYCSPASPAPVRVPARGAGKPLEEGKGSPGSAQKPGPLGQLGRRLGSALSHLGGSGGGGKGAGAAGGRHKRHTAARSLSRKEKDYYDSELSLSERMSMGETSYKSSRSFRMRMNLPALRQKSDSSLSPHGGPGSEKSWAGVVAPAAGGGGTELASPRSRSTNSSSPSLSLNRRLPPAAAAGAAAATSVPPLSRNPSAASFGGGGGAPAGILRRPGKGTTKVLAPQLEESLNMVSLDRTGDGVRTPQLPPSDGASGLPGPAQCAAADSGTGPTGGRAQTAAADAETPPRAGEADGKAGGPPPQRQGRADPGAGEAAGSSSPAPPGAGAAGEARVVAAPASDGAEAAGEATVAAWGLHGPAQQPAGPACWRCRRPPAAAAAAAAAAVGGGSQAAGSPPGERAGGDVGGEAGGTAAAVAGGGGGDGDGAGGAAVVGGYCCRRCQRRSGQLAHPPMDPLQENPPSGGSDVILSPRAAAAAKDKGEAAAAGAAAVEAGGEGEGEGGRPAWPSKKVDEGRLRGEVRRIYDQYLSDTALTETCVPDAVRKDLVQRMQNLEKYGTNVFDKCLADPLKTLQRDILPRFRRSAEYRELVRCHATLTAPAARPLRIDAVSYYHAGPNGDSGPGRFGLKEMTEDRRFHLHEVLQHGFLFRAFGRWLSKRRSAENLYCVHEINRFEYHICNSQHIEAKRIAFLIYRYFVLPGSLYQVSTSAKLRKNIAYALCRPTAVTFQALKGSAQEVLAAEFQAYAVTAEYQCLARDLVNFLKAERRTDALLRRRGRGVKQVGVGVGRGLTVLRASHPGGARRHGRGGGPPLLLKLSSRKKRPANEEEERKKHRHRRAAGSERGGGGGGGGGEGGGRDHRAGGGLCTKPALEPGGARGGGDEGGGGGGGPPSRAGRGRGAGGADSGAAMSPASGCHLASRGAGGSGDLAAVATGRSYKISTSPRQLYAPQLSRQGAASNGGGGRLAGTAGGGAPLSSPLASAASPPRRLPAALTLSPSMPSLLQRHLPAALSSRSMLPATLSSRALGAAAAAATAAAAAATPAPAGNGGGGRLLPAVTVPKRGSFSVRRQHHGAQQQKQPQQRKTPGSPRSFVLRQPFVRDNNNTESKGEVYRRFSGGGSSSFSDAGGGSSDERSRRQSPQQQITTVVVKRR